MMRPVVSYPARLCRAPGRFPALVLLALDLAALPALAQTPAPEVRGRVVAGETRTPLPGVTITVEEGGSVAVTDENGAFTIAVPATGAVHLRASAPGFVPVRQEVSRERGASPLEIVMKDDLHYAEAVTVGPGARDPFESYQPTSVLSGQELGIKLEGSLGGLLRNEPGVSERSLGPGPSRPDHPRARTATAC